MIIEVDIDNIKNNNLTILQYIIGYLLLTRDFNKIETIKSEISEDTLIRILDNLSESRFVSFLDPENKLDYESIVIRNKFRALISDIKNKDFFDELLDIYPTKVKRPDGSTDYLRSDLKRCKAKYKTITNNKLKKHTEILNALKFEIQVRTKEGSLKYMKRLPKWLAEEGWTVYQERMNDVNDNKKIDEYGTELQ